MLTQDAAKAAMKAKFIELLQKKHGDKFKPEEVKVDELFEAISELIPYIVASATVVVGNMPPGKIV